MKLFLQNLTNDSNEVKDALSLFIAKLLILQIKRVFDFT